MCVCVRVRVCVKSADYDDLVPIGVTLQWYYIYLHKDTFFSKNK
jgi:hypothetical protein